MKQYEVYVDISQRSVSECNQSSQSQTQVSEYKQLSKSESVSEDKQLTKSESVKSYKPSTRESQYNESSLSLVKSV